MRRGLVVGLSMVVIGAVTASVSAGSGTSSPIVAAWTQLGPSNIEVARVVVSRGGCPTLTLRSAGGSRSLPMTVRARPDSSFADMVCEAAIPPGTTVASVPGHALPLASKEFRRIALVGDTGCAISKDQDCNDATAWPFAKVAVSIASEHPDLIIHLGDILYRNTKSVCPAGCSAKIDADFFTPAGPMLAAAPLVMVRGNHEAYGADCTGWFRYFAFASAVGTCTPSQRFTPPYKVALTPHRELVVLDTSAAPDNESKYIPEYSNELKQANTLATQPAWLISHVPLWDVAKGKGIEAGPAILERALERLGTPLSPNFRMVISGHLHQFEYLSFTTQVPAQLILGDGGTKMSKAIPIQPGTVVDRFDKVKVLEGQAESVFGYGVIQLKTTGTPTANPKSVTIKMVDGSVYKTCSLHRYHLHC